MTATIPAPIPRYSIRDELDLAWFHGIGQTAFERSTFGGMLDRANNMALKFVWPQQPVLNGAGAIIGYESSITARPTAESREISGYVPDDAALTRYAHISAAMMRVERRDALASCTIAIFFGDAGQRWASTEHGRNGSLYILTKKGKALLEADAKAPGAITLAADERMANICGQHKKRPTPERSVAMATCARQAEELERRARAAWHTVSTT